MKTNQIPSILAFLPVLCLVLIVQGASAAETGDTAPAVQLPQLQVDGSMALADFRGRIVYLDFWASWCPPCLVSMPIMNEMRNRLQAQGVPFEVVAVNVDSDPEDGIDFLLDKPVDFIVLSDPEGRSPADYKVVGMPTSFLVGADGVIVMRHQGFKRSDAQTIENEIMKLAGGMP
jgi:cytochrome c biogenesis protein CcmG/thiol:disulfide interchange protein DsbE